jgi:hypothetical protein
MWQMCNRALRFQEFAQNGAAILLYLNRVWPDWEPALYLARDKKLIGMLPGAAPHCGPQPGGSSPALGWSVITIKPVEAGRSEWSAATEFLMKKLKNVIY